MECSCIRRAGQKFNFYLELLDCDTLVFTDLSNWMTEDYYLVPDEYPMTITFPNGNQKEVMFKPKTTTIFTAEELGPFLDGIYCFTVNSCGYEYKRNRALLCSLECKLDTLVHSINITNMANVDPKVELIKTISTYMKSIETNAALGKVKLATKYFNIVSTELSHIDCL